MVTLLRSGEVVDSSRFPSGGVAGTFDYRNRRCVEFATGDPAAFGDSRIAPGCPTLRRHTSPGEKRRFMAPRKRILLRVALSIVFAIFSIRCRHSSLPRFHQGWPTTKTVRNVSIILRIYGGMRVGAIKEPSRLRTAGLPGSSTTSTVRQEEHHTGLFKPRIAHDQTRSEADQRGRVVPFQAISERRSDPRDGRKMKLFFNEMHGSIMLSS